MISASHMRVGRLICLCTALASTGSARGADPDVLANDAKGALVRATAGMRAISTEGGYLWRYSADLSERWGETKATASQVWVQPPGTPAVGMAFLRAYAATKDPRHLDAAEGAAVALARGQLESGGWDYLIDFDAQAGARWYRRTDRGRVAPDEAARRKNVTTFDDDNTQSALRFLLEYLAAATDRQGDATRELRASLDYGLSKMIEAQYANGGWPQRHDGKPHEAPIDPARRASIPAEYPRQHEGRPYYSHATLNDDAHRDCVLTMLAAHRRTGKAEYLKSAERGGEFLIAAQLPAPQPAWAQQYDAEMHPAWARAFEPPAVSSRESAGAVRTLVDLYLATGQDKYLAPIPAAVEWFKRSELRPGAWARLYELGTNRPVYGDRDGKIHYRLDELTPERRTGYAWEGGFGITEAITYYDEVRQAGRDAYLAERAKPAKSDRDKLAPRVRQAIDSLDANGRWLTNGQIQTRTFIRNVDVLREYLEAGNP
jgi:hypothetical protein